MAWLDDLAGSLRFFSRLPLPQAPDRQTGENDFRRGLRLAPLSGALLGLAGGLVLVAALNLRLPPAAAALLAIACGLLLTGALHEDGLADVADGFGGGVTPERKLEIMKDSRIGAFGASALILSIGLRTSALAALAATPLGAVLVLTAAGAISRCACLAPVILLPPARESGAGRAASGHEGGRTSDAFRIALLIMLPLALVPALGGYRLSACAAALVLAGAAVFGLCALARAQIGGQTGDVAGASQQIGEIVVLLVFAAARPA
jgi:adenosylcobinamide-GDP ribazoletransferase